MPNPSSSLPSSPSKLALRTLSALTILIGLSGLVGWVFDIVPLTRVFSGLATMKANTALCFVLAGTALWLPWTAPRQAPKRNRLWVICRNSIAMGLAAMVMVVGVLTLIEYVAGLDFGIDRLLLAEAQGAEPTPYPGRMAPVTALNFALLGGSLLLLPARRYGAEIIRQLLALLAGFISALAFLGYVYEIKALYGVGSYATVALHTAVAFVLLSAAMLCARPDQGLVAVVTRSAPGGVLARRLLIAVAVVPPVLGWFGLQSQRAGWYGTEFGLAMTVALSMAIFAALIWLGARSINRVQGRILRANRLYAVLSQVNQSILRIHDQERLFREACRIVVEDGLFKLAWIGLVAADTPAVRAVAQYGLESDPVDGWLAALGYGAEQQDPVAGMARAGWRFIGNDVRRDPRLKPLREEMDARGYRSWAVFPIHQHGQVRGILNVYSAEPDFFDQDETKLMEEVTIDLSLALEQMEIKAAHQQAEQALRDSENALRESQARLSGLIASAMDAIISIDRQQNIVLFNTAAERMFQCPQDEALGQPVERFIPARFRAAHRQHVERFGRTGVTAREMGQLGAISGLRADGQEFPIEASISQMETAQGTFYTVILRDITARRQAEQALAESQQRLRATFEQAAVGIAHVAPDGRWLRVNQKLCDIVGYTREELLERTFQDITYPDDLEADLGYRRRALAGELQTYAVEKRYIRKDGCPVWINLTRSLVREPSGEPKYFIAVIEDISRRKAAEWEIRQLNADLEQRVAERTAKLTAVNQELEAFAYSVSHDLRAPLRHIDGFVTLLRKQAGASLNSHTQRYLDIIAEAARKMSTLIDELLAFSRMGRAELVRRPINMESLIQELIQELGHDARQRPVSWQVAALPEVEADPAMLRLVLVNLLGNAVKFTGKQEQPVIEIGCAQAQAGEVVFFVRDNGAGFDMRYADKLFGVFQRLHRVDEFEGTGIGLANVQRIIHRHGGRVWAEGEVNAGATFYFSLPTAAQRDSNHERDQAHPVD